MTANERWWGRNWHRVINLGLTIAVAGCVLTPYRLTWKPYEIVVRGGILVFYAAWLRRPKPR